MNTAFASEDHVDVAIVGGGLVGLALACALAPLGWRVAVLEATPAPAAPDPAPASGDDRAGSRPDPRCFALAGASCRILEGLGVWPAVESQAEPIRKIIVSELGRPGRVQLDPAESGLAAFGQVVPAPVLGQALAAHAATLPGVRLLRPAQVTGLTQDDMGVQLQIAAEASPGVLSASLVVAADGTNSAMREWLNVPVTRRDYGQVAVVCHVTPERGHGGCAFERMTESGPFAMLPLPGGRCGLVWCVDEKNAPDLLALPDADFLARATSRSGRVLGHFSEPGDRREWPLSLVVPDRDVAGRVVLMGNAAHTIHPAGAQGFNLGLRDVATLAEVLSANPQMVTGRPADLPALDAGHAWRLEAYARLRRPDRQATVRMTDGLVGLFGSAWGPARSLRSAGLVAHALSPALRRRLASAAMGYRAPVPALALGQPLQPVGDRTA